MGKLTAVKGAKVGKRAAGVAKKGMNTKAGRKAMSGVAKGKRSATRAKSAAKAAPGRAKAGAKRAKSNASKTKDVARNSHARKQMVSNTKSKAKAKGKGAVSKASKKTGVSVNSASFSRGKKGGVMRYKGSAGATRKGKKSLTAASGSRMSRKQTSGGRKTVTSGSVGRANLNPKSKRFGKARTASGSMSSRTNMKKRTNQTVSSRSSVKAAAKRKGGKVTRTNTDKVVRRNFGAGSFTGRGPKAVTKTKKTISTARSGKTQRKEVKEVTKSRRWAPAIRGRKTRTSVSQKGNTVTRRKSIQTRPLSVRNAAVGGAAAGGYITYKRRTKSGKTITVRRRRSSKRS